MHDRVEIFGRAPRRQHEPENLLDLLLRNLAADESAAALDPLEQPFLHQRADRLAQRHVADAETVGQLLLGRQRGAAGEIADPDLPGDPFAGVVRLRQP